MANTESQCESEQLLWELATQPSSIYKAPTNHYQYFVNAYVLTKPDDETGRCGELCSSGMEGVGCGKQRPVVTALRKALEHLKRNRMKWIDSFLR